MKKLLPALFCLIYSASFANSGGPDAFGYTWKDSNEPGGPVYQWFDITQIGTQINGLGDDNFVGPIQLGGLFPYYWYSESKCWVGSNGYLAFQPGNIAANFPNIPNPVGVNNYIGGLMADLTFLGNNNPGKAYFWANADTFCLAYVNVPYWSPNFPGFTGSNTFEIILNRADSSITVHFQSFSGTSVSNYTSGIENSIGNMGLQPLANQPPQQNYSIKYYYPTQNALQITDAAVNWNDNDNTGGIFLANLGGPYILRSEIENSGNTNIGPVSVVSKVTTLTNSVLVTSSANTPSMVPGQNSMMVFQNPFNPSTTGTRRNVTSISGVAGDTIPVNDSLIQEIVVLDTTQASIRMCYTNNHTNPALGSISWSGGQGGIGVYFKPPSYPIRILNTNFVLTGAPGSGPAFYAKIYADDGPNGSPGTLLDSVMVNAQNVSISSVTQVPVGSNLVLQSGGFYVLWDMASSSVSIAQDLTPPFSRQTYEVFQNIWSTYRDYQICDFFIGVDYANAFPEDVGVCKIQSPIPNQVVGSGSNVSCWIKNYGQGQDNYYIQVNYKLANNTAIVTQPYTGPAFQPGDSTFFTFSTQLVAPYTMFDTLYVWTSKTTDIDHSNDTAWVVVNLVGVEEFVKLEGLDVYPVPAAEQVNFRFTNGTEDAVVLTITDIQGQLVDVIKLPRQMNGSTVSIDLTQYPAGTYFYQIQSGKQEAKGKMIVK
ncbi:MAG: hypothetical protein Fur0041_08080 [Bacteroidia bacterium]